MVLLITLYKAVHDVTFVSVDDGLKRHRLIKIYTSTLAVRLLPCMLYKFKLQCNVSFDSVHTYEHCKLGLYATKQYTFTLPKWKFVEVELRS